MPVKSLACTECHMIIEVQVGNLGWWLKSNNELKAKNKKEYKLERKHETNNILVRAGFVPD